MTDLFGCDGPRPSMEMIDDLPTTHSVAVFQWGEHLVRASVELDGGLDGGSVTVSSRTEGVSNDEAWRGLKVMSVAGYVQGLSGALRRAIARGDVVRV